MVISGKSALAQVDIGKIIEINKNKVSYTERLSLKLPIQINQRDLIFLDVRGNLDTNFKYTGNVGLALRSNIGEDLLVFGIYGFYDYSLSPENYRYNQISGGLELFSNSWEMRLNAYLPVGNQSNVIKIDLDVSATEEVAFRGLDAEIGTKINDNLGIYAGGYYFYRNGYDKISGPRARFTLSSAACNSDMSISAIAQKDSVRGAQFMLGLDFALSPRNSECKQGDLRTAKIRRENFVTTRSITGNIKPNVKTLLNGEEYKNAELLKAVDDLANKIADTDENLLIPLEDSGRDYMAESP